MKRECMKEVFGKEKIDFMDYNPFDCKQMTQLKSDLICVFGCLARKANLVDEDGAINEDAIRELVRTKAEGSEWQTAVADNIVDKCLAEKYEEGKESKCSVAPVKLAHCIWKQFVQSCPAKLQSNASVCKKIRKILSKEDHKTHHIQHAEAAFQQIIEHLEDLHLQ